jgi:hypothetical protein
MEPAEPAAKRAKTEVDSSGVTLALGDGTTMRLAADSPLLVKSETLRSDHELNGNMFELSRCVAGRDFSSVATRARLRQTYLETLLRLLWLFDPHPPHTHTQTHTRARTPRKNRLHARARAQELHKSNY